MALRKLVGGDYSLRMTASQLVIVRDAIEEQMTSPDPVWNQRGLDPQTREVVKRALEIRQGSLQTLYAQLAEADVPMILEKDWDNGNGHEHEEVTATHGRPRK